jgi:ABC-2 type transport system permease protein
LSSELTALAAQQRWVALFYKAGRESSQRFTWALLGLGGLVASIVVASRGFRSGYAVQYPADPLPYAKYIWVALFNYYLQGAWIFASLLLGFGGLRREETLGTSSYTLALPVERSALLWSRFVVGMAEGCTLGIAPALLVPLLSPLVHERYPFGQILLLAIMMIGAGLVFFSFGFCLSSFFGGEFTGPVVGLCVVGTYFFAVRVRSLHRLSVLDVMSGEDVINRITYSIDGSIPWVGVLCSLLASAVLYLSAVKVTRSQDL